MRADNYMKFLCLLTLLITQASAMNITGYVLTPRKAPLQGAVVRLCNAGLTDTTDANGGFSFISSAVLRLGKQPDNSCIRFTSRGILLYGNPSSLVRVEFFDLAGKTILRQMITIPQTGFYPFQYPPKTATKLIAARIGTIAGTRIFKIFAGLSNYKYLLPDKRPVPPLTMAKSAADFWDTLEISHPWFETMRVPLTSSAESLVINFRHWLLKFYQTQNIMPGDTFSNSSENVWISFDSLQTPSCSCYAAGYCAWTGIARSVYTLATHGDTTKFVKYTYSSMPSGDTIIDSLHISLMINNFCGSSMVGASLTIGRTPQGTKPHLFVEDWTVEDGEVISGTGCPMISIDFPTYGFVDSNRTLLGGMRFAINDSLQMILGKGTALQNAAGSGEASSLSPVCQLPYSTPGSDVQFNSINTGGILGFSIGDSSFIVKADSAWVRVTVANDSSNGCVVRKTTTRTITNHGFLNNSQIVPNFSW